MNADWERKLLEAAKRANEAEEKEFLRLVDMAEGNCSLGNVRSLMKTFSNKPDYGTQERVESVLATARAEDVNRGILEELPRLMDEAPDWAECLVGAEIDNHFELRSLIAADLPDKIKDCLRQLTQSDEFIVFYPAAKNLELR